MSLGSLGASQGCSRPLGVCSSGEKPFAGLAPRTPTYLRTSARAQACAVVMVEWPGPTALCTDSCPGPRHRLLTRVPVHVGGVPWRSVLCFIP